MILQGRFSILSLVAIVVFIGSGISIHADPWEAPLIKEIHKLHTESEKGDKKATKKLVKRLEELTKKNPDNALLLAYLGSAYTLASRDAWPGPSKYTFLKDGLKTMDKAVKKSPKEPAVRFIRAVNNFHLPAFINRKNKARKDFEKLLEQIEDEKTRESLNAKTVQAIYYFAGLSLKQLDRDKEAKEAWTKGKKIQGTEELSKKIEKELARLKS